MTTQPTRRPHYGPTATRLAICAAGAIIGLIDPRWALLALGAVGLVSALQIHAMMMRDPRHNRKLQPLPKPYGIVQTRQGPWEMEVLKGGRRG